MKQAGTVNPVIMLDEIDKVGTDFRGDPSAALLEVLDPEQNREFSDHYLEVPYDLSNVLFITTANMVDTISPALRDRMELIRISGYTEAEKLGIAERHLLPRQLEQHGLEDGELTIPHQTLVAILHGYTREAGVRQLDRTIAEIARKVPRRLAAGAESVVVEPDQLSEFLGPQRFDYGEKQDDDEVGAVTGVVVSEVGGDIVTVEALAVEARPDLSLTGQLGSVMEESARAALSWARVHAVEYGAPRDFFETHALHVHVPAGAIPKDGPSAGVTMVTAMVSVASGRRVRRDVAMTGEVTLRGRVLPIGGVKDKLLAAHRSGLTTFILPRKNLRDLEEIPREVLDTVEVVPVDNVGEVLDRALVDAPAQRRERTTGFMLPLRTDEATPPDDHRLMAQALRDLVELTGVVDPTYDQNCYVLHRRDSDAAMLIDPGLQHRAALQLLEDRGWRCERILLTHGHGDHVNGVPAVVAAHGCPVALHPADREQLVSMRFLPGIPEDTPDVHIDEDLADGQVITLARSRRRRDPHARAHPRLGVLPARHRPGERRHPLPPRRRPRRPSRRRLAAADGQHRATASTRSTPTRSCTPGTAGARPSARRCGATPSSSTRATAEPPSQRGRLDAAGQLVDDRRRHPPDDVAVDLVEVHAARPALVGERAHGVRRGHQGLEVEPEEAGHLERVGTELDVGVVQADHRGEPVVGRCCQEWRQHADHLDGAGRDAGLLAGLAQRGGDDGGVRRLRAASREADLTGVVAKVGGALHEEEWKRVLPARRRGAGRPRCAGSPGAARGRCRAGPSPHAGARAVSAPSTHCRRRPRRRSGQAAGRRTPRRRLASRRDMASARRIASVTTAARLCSRR